MSSRDLSALFAAMDPHHAVQMRAAIATLLREVRTQLAAHQQIEFLRAISTPEFVEGYASADSAQN